MRLRFKNSVNTTHGIRLSSNQPAQAILFSLISQLMIYFLGGLLLSCLFSCSDENNAPKEDPLFSTFANHKVYNAKYRVGVSADSVLPHLDIKAASMAFFNDTEYTPVTIYILKHECGDSITIDTNEMPLLSRQQFSNFYYNNLPQLRADTIISPNFFDEFFIAPVGTVDIETISRYPFVFMDVNFNGTPELLIRRDLSHNSFYSYQVYDVSPKGFCEMKTAPYTVLKSRVNVWCFGGATEIDFDRKSITAHFLSSESCSDHGTNITDIYTFNPQTNKFIHSQKVGKYDHCQ